MKKINKKNYIVAGLVIIITFVITFLVVRFYLEQKELSNKEISLNVSEIKANELETYIVDNHDALIYITNTNSKNEIVEKELNRIIVKNNYSKDIVWFDLNNTDKKIYNEFLKKYNISKEEIDSETLLIVKDERVIAIKKINENNIKNLKKYIDTIYYEA